MYDGLPRVAAMLLQVVVLVYWQELALAARFCAGTGGGHMRRTAVTPMGVVASTEAECDKGRVDEVT